MASTIGERMGNIRTKHTAPELEVRRLLYRAGVRYRLHRIDIPGRPDIYVPRLRLAVFVNGCFWHGHSCSRGSLPKTNADWWREKIGRNVVRDLKNLEAVKSLEIDAIVLWTCERSRFADSCAAIATRWHNGSS